MPVDGTDELATEADASDAPTNAERLINAAALWFTSDIDEETDTQLAARTDVSDLDIDTSSVDVNADRVQWFDSFRVTATSLWMWIAGAKAKPPPPSPPPPVDYTKGYLPGQRLTMEKILLRIPECDRTYGKAVTAASQSFGVDRDLILTVMFIESRCRPSSYSGKGAAGLMQLMPATAAWLKTKNPGDPAQNIRGGAKYLAILQENFHRSLMLTLAAYNAGPGNVLRHGGVPPFPETVEYVKDGTAIYKALKAVKARS